jgi:hypothetical protein
VRVLCSEGIANHTGPESCVVHREMQGEALTGESVGQPFEFGNLAWPTSAVCFGPPLGTLMLRVFGSAGA